DNNDGCTTSCTTPFCGNGIVDGATMTTPAEECDDGNANDDDGCLTTCKYNKCGDGHVNTGVEQCDNGTANNGWTKDCLPTCQTNVCGDGYRDMEGTGAAQTEACDDGNNANETACPYGIQSCTLCAMGCDAVEHLTGNVCGDGVPDPMNETCDDQNTVEETSCPYGTPSCSNYCSADCQTQLALTGPFCGDGTVQSTYEGCDDHNANACGTCDAGCNVSASAKATGFIVAPAGSAISDDATLRIRDGFGRDVTFEFDDDASGPSTMGNIVIDFVSSGGSANTAAQMRTKIRTAINSGTADLGITATDGDGTFVLLANDRKSSLGNVTIITSDSDIIVSGMSGGAGGDCLAGLGCNSNDDCRSNNCNTSAHVCRCASDADCATGTCMSGTCM
ncbi:MAG TPA: DUF4215 domain-containing protein, partial [Kofleriaceae bacterium]|nr:DUF4215 domain-containing protein [Kofleriaceae bacterium]